MENIDQGVTRSLIHLGSPGENLLEATGKALGAERKRHRENLDALRSEIAALRGKLQALKADDERVIDMRRHIRGGRDAA